MKCEFCDRLTASPETRPWHDFHIIDSTDHFVTIASLGALVAGSVLIVPTIHVFSMASLNRAWRAELYRYEHRIRALLTAIWGRPTLFEHGACSDPLVRTGACVSHAHWHLVPGDYDLDGHGLTFDWAPSFEAIVAAKRPIGYLAFRGSAGVWQFNADHRPPGQHFRRLIAAQLGRADDWDYLAFPMLDNVRATIVGLTGVDPVTS